MPVPDFSPGEVLTAAAMDSIGLWLVKTQTIGTGVSSVTVTNAFSADYDNYKIIVGSGSASTDILIDFRLGSTATGYNQFSVVGVPTSNTVSGSGKTNQVRFISVGRGSSAGLDASIELNSPFLPKITTIKATNTRPGTGNTEWINGYLSGTTSYTDFELNCGAATMTGGTIRVYGYRN